VRHHVHQHLYDQITQWLSPDDIGRLEALLSVYKNRTEFIRMKATPRCNTCGSGATAWIGSIPS
jgi:hypothetical protein